MKTNFSKNQFTITMDNKEIVRVSITAKDSYNYASITVKPTNGDDYCELSYSWKGDSYIPSFVLEIMSFIKTISKDKASTGELYVNEEEYAKYKSFVGE